MAKNNTPSASTGITNFNNLRDKIYTIRGAQVMLDYDLAVIYGYTTSAFNQQVKNNIEKFDEDFRFQLTKEEVEALTLESQNTALDKTEFPKSKNLISKNLISKNETRGGNRHLPYAFTEQGIYMLMTVLKGNLATQQSKALIRTFHAMKTYIADNRDILDYRSELKSLLKIMTNVKDIKQIKSAIKKLNSEIESINHRLDDALTRADVSPILLDFSNTPERREFLIFNGELTKASETYINLYAKAKHNVCIIDDYVSVKTLRHLQDIGPDVQVTIFTDNVGKYLHASDYLDFCQEFPKIKIEFIKTNKLVHDRFIVLDYNTDNECIYHCGASSKDAGKRITAISKLDEKIAHVALHKIIEIMSANPKLMLK